MPMSKTGHPFLFPVPEKLSLNKLKHIGMGKNMRKTEMKPSGLTQHKKCQADEECLLSILITETQNSNVCDEGLRARKNWEGENA